MTAPTAGRLDALAERLSDGVLRSIDGRTLAGSLGAYVGFALLVGVMYPAPPAVLFLGLVVGSVSALIAMGLVLVYRANRIVNFAQGDMGAVAGVLATGLMIGADWNFFPAALVGFVASIGLVFCVERFVIRRFARAPRLVLTVATIGLAQLFQVLQLVVPTLFDFAGSPQPPVPFNVKFEWFPIVFRAGHVMVVLVVPFVAVALAVFFRRSRAGVGVRAAAESADRAALLGVPVRSLNSLVWLIAGGLSSLGVLLLLPIQGVSIGTPLGPTLLLRALAAGVIGRMESLPRTAAAAVVLGVIEQAVLFRTGRTVVVDAVLFAVILLTLLVQRSKGDDRAADAGVSSWSSTREVRPIPGELARLPEVRLPIIVGGVAVFAGLALVPPHLSVSQVNLLGVGLIFAMLMASLLILTGWAGQISLGQLAIAALGGAAAGSMAQNGHNILLCVFVAGVAGAIVSVLLGIPALRIRGPFLAVTTLAFAVSTGTFFLNREFFPWLVPDPTQRVLRPVIGGKFDLESEFAYYYVLLFALLAALGSVSAMRRSRTGRALVANRDNSRAAQSYGIEPVRSQLTAFALSGFLSAVAGGLYWYHQHGLSSTLLEVDNNFKVFSVAVIGGLGSIPGALLSALYLALVDYSPLTRSPFSRLFASGVGVLVILLVLPGGLGGLVYDVRDRLLRIVARRRDIVVPSLLADVRVDESGDHATAERPVVDPPDDGLLVTRGIGAGYGRTQVLFGVDAHVSRGEIVALLGTNGAGKSTLLSVVSGLLRPGAGRVTYAGHDVTGASPQDMIGNGAVLVPGGRGVFPTLTVREHLALAGWTYDKTGAAGLAEVTDRALDMFPRLRERIDARAGNMSGGEQQMLALAMAFIVLRIGLPDAPPDRLLMIDELSLGLAPIVVEQLLGIVRAIHADGTTVVLVEQSVNVAITVADRAVFMEKGEVRFDGPTADLLDRPDVLRAVFLEGAGAPAKAKATTAPAVRKVFEPKCDHCGHEHPDALSVHGLGVRFGGVTAVNGVDLTLAEHQILGLIGANGAGKTTILDLISGFLAPTSGRVVLNGHDVTDLPPPARAALGLGRSFQDARLFPSMTVRQTIATALERHIPVPEVLAAALMSPAVTTSEKAVAAEVERLIDLMRLGAYADKFVGELSTGTRRIVDLACVLAHRPSVLLLDEPSSGIAQRETEALGPVLLDIREQLGASMIVIEHDMPLITAIADELVALELGTVIVRGDADTVVNHPDVVAGYLGGGEATVNRSGATPGRPVEQEPTKV